MAKILIVENDKDSYTMLRLMLELNGHDVIIATDGEEGLEATTKNKPDLIISDVDMPNMDGFELCYIIKTTDTLKNIPVLLLTAKYPKLIPGMAPRVEADDYMIKPYEIDRLYNKVSELLSKK